MGTYIEADLTCGLAVIGAVGDVRLARESGTVGLRGDDGEMESGEEELQGGKKGLHADFSVKAVTGKKDWEAKGMMDLSIEHEPVQAITI